MKDIVKESGQRGTALVESALTLLLFFMLVLGIMELGRFINVQQVITNAAREGARRSVAPLSGTSNLASVGEVQGQVNTFLQSANITGATTTVEQSVTIAENSFTRVTVTVPYQLLSISLFSDLQVNLKGQALMRNETSP